MQVYYKRIIEGITTPAIIHNSSYFLIDMPIYEDGSIDCWERIELDEVFEKLQKGWLVTSVPDGKNLSVHGLGAFCIKTARWNHTHKSYVKYLHDVVKSMNGKMTGLFKKTEEQKKKWASNHVSWGAKGTPYRISGNFGYDMIDGCSTKMFMKKNGEYYLVNITGFADGTYQIENTEGIVTAQEITDMIEQKILVCSPPSNVPVHINDFGTIEVAEVYWAAEPSEKLKEILDFPNKAGKKETAHDHCRKIYHSYLEYPNETTRDMLREAYEAVPEHERMYLGDMDSKDSDYWRILYEPDVKREV